MGEWQNRYRIILILNKLFIMKGFTPLEVFKNKMLRKIKLQANLFIKYALSKNPAKLLTGFTLLETIISVAILAAMVVGSLTLISKSMQSAFISQNRLIASYLAQEGIELVRNVRDSNWEDDDYPVSVDWDDDLPDCENCEMDYTTNVLADGGDPFLKLDSDNFYNYSLGADTIFRRRISLKTIFDRQKQVIVEIIWQYQGSDHNLAVTAFLYNWQ